MTIDIQTRGFDLTAALDQHVRTRLALDLGTHQSCIANLRVRLSDINGPRGGADKRCRVHIELPGLRAVVVDNTDTDMYTAISNAVKGAAATLNRRLSKRRSRTQRRISQPVSSNAELTW